MINAFGRLLRQRAIKRFVVGAHLLQAVARRHVCARARMLRSFCKQTPPGPSQTFVVAFCYDPAAIANDLGTVANVRGDARHIAGHRLAQHIRKAFAVDGTEREHIESGINQLDVQSWTKQNDVAVKVESPNLLCQSGIVGAEPTATEDKSYILMILLKARGSLEERAYIFHRMIARDQTNHCCVGGNSQSRSQHCLLVLSRTKAF